MRKEFYKKPEMRHTKILTVYLTEREKKVFDVAVEASHLTQSDFIRQALKVVIESGILDYENSEIDLDIEEITE